LNYLEELFAITIASFYVIRGQSYVVVKITNNEITDLIMTTQVSYIKLLRVGFWELWLIK